MTYIYAEPDTETREVFLDQYGEPHLDRDAAITSNIKADLERALREQLARAFPDAPEERKFMASVLVSQVASRHNPLRETIRALIESTD